ncbi:NAD(P)/FAD-dependent oxidoreductase [Amycolatopsis pithecellobii]|uniref:FAD-dependent oxidoreductase n=1 Tax=Amycolatopsis pithecellobii TaxID=664692 RepID=A0A6N7Z565_9PSEU|nr:FAD-dependent oxidoreductase [Amycolatopsis pithecellobii]MTD55600.1 FAD-dependent oxidoreductase [Amycolatopsis pithecellobii]
MKIVVVGAGSVGAHIGYRLAARGADVVLVDAANAGSGTSSASFSWMSSFPHWSWPEDEGRARLRRQIQPRYRELHEEIGGDWLHWSGGLNWVPPDERDQWLSAYATCRELGLDLELLDGKAVRERVPELHLSDDDEVIWEPGSGWVDAPALIALLISNLKRLGAQVITGRAVVEMPTTSDAIRGVGLDDGTRLDADVVVNAAGSWSAHLAALAGLAVPLDLVPGLMVYTQPLENGMPAPVINSLSWLARRDPSGGLALHRRGVPMSAGYGGNGFSAQAIIDEVAQMIPVLAGTAPARVRVGVRPIPPGGPVIGEVPWLRGLYFAVSHGGIGWAPVWADAAASELLDGVPVADLAGLRPTRFFLDNRSRAGRFADDFEVYSAG